MKIIVIIIGAILLIHGLYSIYSAIKGKSLQFYISPGDTFIVKKLFGGKGEKAFFNFFWGVIEIILSVLIFLGKFN